MQMAQTSYLSYSNSFPSNLHQILHYQSILVSSFPIYLLQFIWISTLQLIIEIIEMQSVWWYMNLYYKYREYPAKQINSQYKKSELKAVYANIFTKLTSYFAIDSYSDSVVGPPTGLVSLTSCKSIRHPIISDLKNTQKSIKYHNSQTFSSQKFRSLSSKTGKSEKQALFNNQDLSESKSSSSQPYIQAYMQRKKLDILTKCSLEQLLIIAHQLRIKYMQLDESSSEIEELRPSISNIPTQKNIIDQSNSTITLQRIPVNNEQIKIFFISFCSTVKLINSSACQNSKSEMPKPSSRSSESFNDFGSEMKKPDYVTGTWELNRTEKQFEKELQRMFISNRSSKVEKNENDTFESVLNEIYEKELGRFPDYFSKYQSVSHRQKQLQIFSSNNIQWDLNLFLQIWYQLLFMNQSCETIYQLIDTLLSNTHSPFIDKISTYMHFIIFIKTKKLIIQILSKINFISIVFEVCQKNRYLSDIKIVEENSVIEIWDILLQRNIYQETILEMFKQKLVEVGVIVSEELAKDPTIFWGKLLYDCFVLLDQEYNHNMAFAYSALHLTQKINDYLNSKEAYQTEEQTRNAYNKSVNEMVRILQKELNLWESGSEVCSASSHNIKSQSGIETEMKIFEIEEWQKNMRNRVIWVKCLNLILDESLDFFAGNSLSIVEFFLDTYQNMQFLQDIMNIPVLQCIIRYCHTCRTAINRLDTIKSSSSLAFSQKQLLIHASSFKFTSNLLKKLQKNHKEKLKQKRLLKNVPIEVSEQISHQAQSQFYQASEYEGNELKLLGSGVLKEFMDKVSVESYDQSVQLQENEQDLRLLEEINNYMYHVNVYNLMLLAAKNLFQNDEMKQENSDPEGQKTQKTFKELAEVQPQSTLKIQETHSEAPTFNQLPKQKILIPFITTEQITKQIEMLAPRFDIDKKPVVSFKRSFSSSGTPDLQSRDNGLITSYNPNILKMREEEKSPSMLKGSVERGNMTVVYEKIIQKIQLHRSCFELMLKLFQKCSEYYKEYCKNCISQDFIQIATSSFSQRPPLQVDDIHQISQKQLYKELSLLEMKEWLHKYESICKNRTLSDFQKLTELQYYFKKHKSIYEIKKQILLEYEFLASFEVNTETFRNIENYELLSKDKFQKLKVIGKNYYEKLYSMLKNDYKLLKINEMENQFTSSKTLSAEESFYLESYQQIYKKHLLLIIQATIQFIYNSTPDQTQSIGPFMSLVNQYFSTKTYKINQNERSKANQELIQFGKCMQEVFDWNSFIEDEQVTQNELIAKMIEIRKKENCNQFLEQFHQLLKYQTALISKMESQKTKVEHLEMKLCYLMMREIYFYEYYDKMAFQSKPRQAKKNYHLYEQKMVEFFEEIGEKDIKEFQFKRKEELKERSKFLQGYLANYQNQPASLQEEKLLYRKIVCIFDKTLSLITQNKKLQMKKRSSNSFNLLTQSKHKDPIYMHYVSTEYTKPNGECVKVFDLTNYNFFQAIRIYESFLEKKTIEGQRRCSIMNDLHFSGGAMLNTLNSSQMETIEKNKQSLLALWVNEECSAVYQKQVLLTQKAFLLKIQKLYVELDVRHKVFESFKNRILNYEMQKTQIYHQYMDYIKGLKLDVYSHLADEDPLPFFKLMNGVKLFRLEIKKKELEERVNEEFGKNLGKWNQGIKNDLDGFCEWVAKQKNEWVKNNEECKRRKKQLEDINFIIVRQLKRQREKKKKGELDSESDLRENTIKSRNNSMKPAINRALSYKFLVKPLKLRQSNLDNNKP